MHAQFDACQVGPLTGVLTPAGALGMHPESPLKGMQYVDAGARGPPGAAWQPPDAAEPRPAASGQAPTGEQQAIIARQQAKIDELTDCVRAHPCRCGCRRTYKNPYNRTLIGPGFNL